MTQRWIGFEHLWTAQGWLSPGFLCIDEAGRVVRVCPNLPEDVALDDHVRGPAVPGMPNTHSHAFQRALAGRCELGSSGGEDNLWTWRQRMYALAQAITPEQYEALAAFAYMEMLEHGFTQVAEFHYLHHAPGGRPYADPAEMSLRLAAAARRAGIGLTLLPTLYAHAGIDRPLLPDQARFGHTDVDRFLRLLESLQARSAQTGARVGMALHSLRAVTPAELHAAVAGAGHIGDGLPIHIHVSETLREVNEVCQGLGARPVQWLLANAGIDQRWTLVHATHLTADERAAMARSGALASLCPTTEATLGDGLFPLPEYQREGGAWAIGTDSHYASGVAAELRMLECGQRLRLGRRNVLAQAGSDPRTLGSGHQLFTAALRGARSLGELPALAKGAPADVVVLDSDSPSLAGHGLSTVLDAWLLSGIDDPVRDVLAAGQWVVRDGRHRHREGIVAAYVHTIGALMS